MPLSHGGIGDRSRQFRAWIVERIKIGFCRSKPWRDSLGMTKTPDRKPMIDELRRVIKRLNYPVEVMLLSVRR